MLLGNHDDHPAAGGGGGGVASVLNAFDKNSIYVFELSTNGKGFWGERHFGVTFHTQKWTEII
jgi:hypothetical protein